MSDMDIVCSTMSCCHDNLPNAGGVDALHTRSTNDTADRVPTHQVNYNGTCSNSRRIHTDTPPCTTYHLRHRSCHSHRHNRHHDHRSTHHTHDAHSSHARPPVHVAVHATSARSHPLHTSDSRLGQRRSSSGSSGRRDSSASSSSSSSSSSVTSSRRTEEETAVSTISHSSPVTTAHTLPSAPSPIVCTLAAPKPSAKGQPACSGSTIVRVAAGEDGSRRRCGSRWRVGCPRAHHACLCHVPAHSSHGHSGRTLTSRNGSTNRSKHDSNKIPIDCSHTDHNPTCSETVDTRMRCGGGGGVHCSSRSRSSSSNTESSCCSRDSDASHRTPGSALHRHSASTTAAATVASSRGMCDGNPSHASYSSHRQSYNDPVCHSRTASAQEWVRLNVGGRIFVTTVLTLSADPDSLLARLCRRRDARMDGDSATRSSDRNSHTCIGVNYTNSCFHARKDNNTHPRHAVLATNTKRVHRIRRTTTSATTDTDDDVCATHRRPPRSPTRPCHDTTNTRSHHHHHHHHHSSDSYGDDTAATRRAPVHASSSFRVHPIERTHPAPPLDTDADTGILLDLDPDYFAVVLNFCRHRRVIIPPQLSLTGVRAVARYLHLTAMLRQLRRPNRRPVRPRQLFSWGSGSSGELGTQRFEDCPTPTAVQIVPFGVRVVHMALGANYSCALAHTGEVYSFGNGDWGQLGLGNPKQLDTLLSDKSAVVAVPRRVSLFESTYTDCTGGGDSAAEERDGDGNHDANRVDDGDPASFVHWGANGTRRGTMASRRSPSRRRRRRRRHAVVRVSAGYAFAMAITCAREVYFWGNNNHGQSGLGPAFFDPRHKKIDTPQRIDTLQHKRIIEVGCGSFFGLALSADGSVYGWGLIECLGLGDPAVVRQRYRDTGLLAESMSNEKRAVLLVPQRIAVARSSAESPVIHIHAGQWHSGAITKRGELFTWGVGYQGRLGHGSKEPAYVPTRVKGALTGHCVCAVACGSFHTVALTTRGVVFCWGDNASGQCGTTSVQDDTCDANPSRTSLPDSVSRAEAILSPYRVVGLEFIAGGVARGISCGRQHTLVVMAGPQPDCTGWCCQPPHRPARRRGGHVGCHGQVYKFGDWAREARTGATTSSYPIDTNHAHMVATNTNDNNNNNNSNNSNTIVGRSNNNVDYNPSNTSNYVGDFGDGRNRHRNGGQGGTAAISTVRTAGASPSAYSSGSTAAMSGSASLRAVTAGGGGVVGQSAAPPHLFTDVAAYPAMHLPEGHNAAHPFSEATRGGGYPAANSVFDWYAMRHGSTMETARNMAHAGYPASLISTNYMNSHTAIHTTTSHRSSSNPSDGSSGSNTMHLYATVNGVSSSTAPPTMMNMTGMGNRATIHDAPPAVAAAAAASPAATMGSDTFHRMHDTMRHAEYTNHVPHGGGWNGMTSSSAALGGACVVTGGGSQYQRVPGLERYDVRGVVSGLYHTFVCAEEILPARPSVYNEEEEEEEESDDENDEEEEEEDNGFDLGFSEADEDENESDWRDRNEMEHVWEDRAGLRMPARHRRGWWRHGGYDWTHTR